MVDMFLTRDTTIGVKKTSEEDALHRLATHTLRDHWIAFDRPPSRTVQDGQGAVRAAGRGVMKGVGNGVVMAVGPSNNIEAVVAVMVVAGIDHPTLGVHQVGKSSLKDCLPI